MRKTVKNLNKLYASAFEKMENMSKFIGKDCVDHALDFHYGHRIKIGKQFTNEKWYMPSEKKTWARYTFIKQNGRVKPADVLIGEKIFQKRYGVESCALMEKFPITKEVVEFVNCEYNKLAERNGDKKLEIKFDDLQKKDKEKGE